MKGVAISGIKGGTGKTSIAHALALGAAWRGVPAYLCHTDNREPISVNGRPYAYYDARKPETLQTLASAALNSDGLFIIDGGGNRPAFDAWIAQAVDLVVIPVSPDPEDVHEALRHADAMRQAGAEQVGYLVNKYPSNHFERDFIFKYLDQIPADQIIGKVGEVKAVRTLREPDEPEFQTPVSKVNNFSRTVYRLISSAMADG